MATVPSQATTALGELAAGGQFGGQSGGQARDSSSDELATGLLEVLQSLDRADDLTQACRALADGLPPLLGCRRVAVALRRGRGRACRLMAVSGLATVDPRSDSAQAFEDAAEEAVLRDEPTAWPCAAHGVLAHRRLSSLEGSGGACSSVLRDRCGHSIGALLALTDTGDAAPRCADLLQAAEPSVAAAVESRLRLEGGLLSRLERWVLGASRTAKGRAVAAALLLAAAVLAVPAPYRLKCDCTIEPVTRRFVVAPFAGALEKPLVRPGDLVSQDQTLARLDGREIRWERAGVEASRNAAEKKHDSALAAGRYSEAQIAKLEMERLDVQLRLLDLRAQHLEIRSPIDGIVTSGDLQRVEGAPLTTGQTLFEVAPLEQMIVEVAVADEDMSYARSEQPVVIELDAYPGRQWTAALTGIHPRSEIRDGQNVFVAEARLDNESGLLRPGMKGRARIHTPRRPLGWILFHRPWERLMRLLSW